MIRKILKDFFKLEAVTGILLLIVTILALFIANSNESEIYFQFLQIHLPLNLDFLGIYKNLTLLEWINDALMAIFFLLIGLELKQEVLVGELSSKEKVALPAFAAIGGVIVPALIFFYFNVGIGENMRGFAIPTATDIAFAYGMLCLFGKKIPSSLKIFLIALAVLDDLVAILIIAIFYTQNLNLNYLALALLPIAALAILNFRRVNHLSFYLFCGVFLWLFVLKSGVHATLAGVICAMFIPLSIKKNDDHPSYLHSPLERLAEKLGPVVNYIILPVFAFANAGVRVENFSFEILLQPLVLGIICGLFFGKQIGVFLFSYLAVKLKLCSLPQNVSWFRLYGVAIFTGIGFTMSLFIGNLAFVSNQILIDEVKIGVLVGSLLSMIFGLLVNFLVITLDKKNRLLK